MSVQIIDNFKLNASLPIDSRIVIGGDNYYQNKEDIEYKYSGLRIWDLNDQKAWVWDGVEWVLENEDINLDASNNFLTKVSETQGSKSLVNSILYEINGSVGIDTIDIEDDSKLQVNGIIRSTSGGFYGNGKNITDIDARKITTGNLPLARLSGGGENNVLIGTSGEAKWESITNLFSNQIESNVSNSSQYLVFASGVGNNKLRINEGIRINPRNNNISIGTNILNNKLTVNGSVSIGTTSVAPENGLLIEGKLLLKGVDTNIESTKKVLTIDSNNIVGYALGDFIPIGGIVMWSNALIPNGWVFCDGSSYNTEKGEVITPDLRERFIVCASSTTNVEGIGYLVGQTGGEAQVVLKTNQMPPHTHNLHGSIHQKQEPSTIGSERLYLFPDGPSGGINSTVSASNGNGEAHENRPPYYSLVFIMYIGSII